jgi:hypothetical protein
MQKIKKIGVLSFAKIYGAILATIMLIVGLIATVITVLIGLFVGSIGPGVGVVLGFTLAGIILYGIFGFVAGAIGSYIYNIVASKVGGIEIELEK